MWMIVVILQCILAKIIPGISILVMNVIIIVKVIFSSKCLYITLIMASLSAEKDLEKETEAVRYDEEQRALTHSSAWLQ